MLTEQAVLGNHEAAPTVRLSLADTLTECHKLWSSGAELSGSAARVLGRNGELHAELYKKAYGMEYKPENTEPFKVYESEILETSVPPAAVIGSRPFTQESDAQPDHDSRTARSHRARSVGRAVSVAAATAGFATLIPTVKAVQDGNIQIFGNGGSEVEEITPVQIVEPVETSTTEEPSTTETSTTSTVVIVDAPTSTIEPSTTETTATSSTSTTSTSTTTQPTTTTSSTTTTTQPTTTTSMSTTLPATTVRPTTTLAPTTTIPPTTEAPTTTMPELSAGESAIRAIRAGESPFTYSGTRIATMNMDAIGLTGAEVYLSRNVQLPAAGTEYFMKYDNDGNGVLNDPNGNGVLSESEQADFLREQGNPLYILYPDPSPNSDPSAVRDHTAEMQLSQVDYQGRETRQSRGSTAAENDASGTTANFYVPVIDIDVNGVLPGEEGNVLASGHRTWESAPFSSLDLMIRTGGTVSFRLEDGTPAIYQMVDYEVIPVDETNGAAVYNHMLNYTGPQGETSTLTVYACEPQGSSDFRLVLRFVMVPNS